MDECFGLVELVEVLFKVWFMDLFDFMDCKKFYVLYDLLIEVEIVKNFSEYSIIFFYFDLLFGVRFIIQKLLKQIQEKWVICVINYKK